MLYHSLFTISMTIFITILLKLIPLYFMILLGFIWAKSLKAQKETVAKLLIYIIAPCVIFYGTYTAEINIVTLSLPLLFFCIASIMAVTFLMIWKYIFGKDSTKNILAFTAGTGNTGYFGLPVIAAVLGEQAFSLATLSILWFVLYENSIGFFLTANWSHTTKESLWKIITLPTIYAFFLGLLLHIFHINIGGIVTTMIWHFKGAYTLLGMMIIGMGLATVSKKEIDYKFISLTFLAKFIFWPLIIIGIIALDKHFFHIYNTLVYNVMLIMAIVPLAANTVAIATELQVHPNKAALAVLLSTLFALFYIPLLASIYIIH